MNIAFIGIRGIPVVYSGYETFSEICATELVKRGHQITVYCRSAYVNPKKSNHKGVRLVVLPTIKSKNFDTIFHSFISTVHACFSSYDTILYLSVGNSLFSFLPRLFGKRTVVNVDGMDWKRKKWGRFAKWFLNTSEWLATFLPNEIVTDSDFIEKYYLEKYRKKSVYIPYGGFTKLNTKNTQKILKKYGLKRGNYFIWNGRMVPDNHIEDLILAYRRVNSHFKCIILGDDLYSDTYKNYLLSLASGDNRFIFPGFVTHDTAGILIKNSYAYVETKRSGGTHPSLVEAMSLGALIVTDDCSANVDVLGNNAYVYSQEKGSTDLARVMRLLMQDSQKARNTLYKRNIVQRYKKEYSWNTIVSKYEQVLCPENR